MGHAILHTSRAAQACHDTNNNTEDYIQLISSQRTQTSLFAKLLKKWSCSLFFYFNEKLISVLFHNTFWNEKLLEREYLETTFQKILKICYMILQNIHKIIVVWHSLNVTTIAFPWLHFHQALSYHLLPILLLSFYSNHIQTCHP